MQNPCDHRNFDALKTQRKGQFTPRKCTGRLGFTKSPQFLWLNFLGNFVAFFRILLRFLRILRKSKFKNIYLKYGMHGRILFQVFDEVLLDVEIAMQLLFSFDQISKTVMQALA